jgi:hypothetical protein
MAGAKCPGAKVRHSLLECLNLDHASVNYEAQ